MRMIQTVRGPIPAGELGATLAHEHLFVKHPELEENYPHPEWDEDRLMETARQSLQELSKKGIGTLVDLTVMGLGRYIPRVQRLAAHVDMNIVVATGYYTPKDLPTYFHNHGPDTVLGGRDPLEEMFIRDIVEGIADTGVKAAIIKVVTDRFGLTPDVERVIRAAAVAHSETGAPISTHASVENHSGRLQQNLFRSLGVDLGRVVIGHSGDTTDLDYLRELMDNGSTIGMDRFGITGLIHEAARTETERVDTVVKLVKEGYADRMLLSHDASFFSINSEPSARARLTPDWHHHYISDRILPALLESGVSQTAIDRMMIENPARILSGTAN